MVPLLAALIVLMGLAACSTKKNTAGSRFWHSFTAKYNTYFNGHQAFLDAEKAKAVGHKDNFTRTLPVFLVGNEASRTIGRSGYETAIKKCKKAITLHSIKRRPAVSASKSRKDKTKQYLKRKEFNPFLRHAWLLMGESQFEKGDFLEAAATFSYISRLYAAEPDVAAEARQWLARCYSQIDWFYDADEALKRAKQEPVTPRQAYRLARMNDVTQADMLVRQERFAEALPYLRKSVKVVEGSYRKARIYYLIGQVEHQLGHSKEAYQAFGRCIKKSPPLELSLGARIMQSEVMIGNKQANRSHIKKLQRMARQSNYKEYVDRIYYAIGNIHLAGRDTAQAIAAYEKGRTESTRNGVEKGVLLIRLGEIYWTKRRFDLAQTCYNEALSMIDKEEKDFALVTRRSSVLDKLVPFTSSIHLQDSLQALARMSETDRNAAIDRVIAELKRKEKLEREAKRDSAAAARAAENGNETADNRTSLPGPQNRTNEKNVWYFYNPTAVMQGKQDFRKAWGNRKNEDNWRRSNRTVVKMDDEAGYDYAAADSLEAVADSLALADKQGGDAAGGALADADDPHKRAYYLKDIPFTPEAKAASDEVLMDALYNAGVIEKDDLEDFPLAEETLRRLSDAYPRYKNMADVYYHLFLLYSRQGKTTQAEQMKQLMAAHYPTDERTLTITNPNFLQLARHGREMEDSLYSKAYDAYRNRQPAEVERLYDRSTADFPKGANRPKFMFVRTLSHLKTASTPTLIKELRDLLKQFPESDVSPMAGMIVKGLESGRAIGTGSFDLGSLWSRRTATADSLAKVKSELTEFTPERVTPYLFVLAYPADSIQPNALLYDMAHFNFTTYVVKGFDMTFNQEPGITQFRVAGFNTYDEALTYARRLYKDDNMRPYLEKGRVLIISKKNLDLIGSRFSYDDFADFYNRTFAPIEVEKRKPTVVEPPIEQHYEDEYTPEELERIQHRQQGEDDDENGGATDDDGGVWY